MEKNNKKRLGIVVVMLVLILAIGAAAGTTLAKYISSATVPSQTATVAKWGFTITATSEKLFSKTYNAGVKTTGSTVDVSAFANASDDIVAPGTEGSAKMLTIGGKAEVNSLLTIDVSTFAAIVLNTPADTAGATDNKYYPLQWKVGSAASYSVVKSNTELATLIQSNLTLPAGLTATVDSTGTKILVAIPAGTDLGTEAISMTIAWKWDFHTSDDIDALDTILAQISNGTTVANYSATTQVQIGFSVTLEQTTNKA